MLAEQTGVPVAPWSGGPVETVEDGLRHAATIGYPLIIKSRSGGGGRGIRIVRSEDELADALERTQVEAAPHVRRRDHLHGAAGRGRPAHRGAGDRRPARQRVGAGRARLLGAAAQPEADRGVQLPRAEPRAGRLAARVGQGAGQGRRLRQRGHRRVPLPARPRSCSPSSRSTPACRSSTPSPRRRPGLDIVKLQIHVAAGGRLEGERAGRSSATPSRPGSTPRTPSRSSRPPPAPSSSCGCPPGRASASTPACPSATSSRPTYDSMIAKIIAWGRDRPEALARLRVAPARHHRRDPRRDDDEVLPALPARPPRGRRGHRRHRPGWTAPAPAAAPIPSGTPRSRSSRSRSTSPTPRRRRSGPPSSRRPAADGPAPRTTSGRTVELGYRGQQYKLTVAKVDPGRYRVWLDGRHVDVDDGPAQRAGEPAQHRRRALLRRRLARGHVAPGRGRRRHPPRHPRRGGRGARAGARRRRRRPRRRR